jgi:fatty-acid desaturase
VRSEGAICWPYWRSFPGSSVGRVSRSPGLEFSSSADWELTSAITGCSATEASNVRSGWSIRLLALRSAALKDAPARWVAAHRLHHHRADERRDPHSPLVALFWAYMGWLFIENTDLNRIIAYDRYARDIIRDRFYAWLERAFVWVILASWFGYFAVGFLAGLALGETLREAVQFGASIWLWGAIVRTILVWHITWCGNSFPHLYGYRNYQTNDNSRNNFIVAVITSGEGWHNNHHAEPDCGRWT